MHPYIYQLTVDAIEAENQRNYDNQRWLRDLPKRPSRIQTLWQHLTVLVLRMFNLTGEKIKAKRTEYTPVVEAECLHSTGL
jgi:hypothetical protein